MPTRSFSGTSRISCAQIAKEIDASGKQVFSVLGPVTTAELQKAFPKSVVARIMPNTPVQLRQGVCCIAKGGEAAMPLFERVGKVFVLPESQMNLATATIGVTPAYIAVIVEAMIDAAARQWSRAEARHGQCSCRH